MGGYVYDIRDDQDHPPWQEGCSLRRCYSLLRSFKALHRLRAATPTRRARAATGQARRADVQCGTGAEIGGAGQERRPGRLCQARLAAASVQCRMTAPDAEQDVFRRHATSVNVPRRLSSLGRMNTLASWAEQLARALLQEPLPRRWAHVQGVAARAAAWHLFSALTPISWKPPRGCTTSATRPALP